MPLSKTQFFLFFESVANSSAILLFVRVSAPFRAVWHRHIQILDCYIVVVEKNPVIRGELTLPDFISFEYNLHTLE